MRCTVVIPTYNERLNIEELVSQILSLGPEYDVLIVDDNSPDGTGEVVAQLVREDSRVDVIHRAGKAGLGTAYMAGLTRALSAGVDYVAQMDADFSHAPEYLAMFLTTAEETGADVVIGTRYAQGGRIRNWPLTRHLLSRVGNGYARLLLGKQFSDYTSGFMLHRASALRKIPFGELGCTNFAFLLELKVEYGRRGLHTVEMPIEFVNRTRGNSKITLAVVFEAFRIVLRIHERLRRGEPLEAETAAVATRQASQLSTPQAPRRKVR